MSTMSKTRKCLRESNRELDVLLSKKSDIVMLTEFRKLFNLQVRLANTFLRGQVVLRRRKKLGLPSKKLEELLGPVVEMKEIGLILKEKGRMRIKINELTKKIRETA